MPATPEEKAAAKAYVAAHEAAVEQITTQRIFVHRGPDGVLRGLVKVGNEMQFIEVIDLDTP